MKQVAVIGLGKFGSTVAKQLVDLGAEVLAIDRRKPLVEGIKDTVTYAAALDATDETALKAVNIRQMDCALVCIGDDVEANLLCTLLLKKLGIPQIWSRSISTLQEEILRALEVTEIMNLEEQMGRLVARSLMSENIRRHIELGSHFSLAEVPVGEAFAGRSLEDIGARGKFHVNVVAIKRHVPEITPEGERKLREEVDNVPVPEAKMEEGTILICVGRDEDLERFSQA